MKERVLELALLGGALACAWASALLHHATGTPAFAPRDAECVRVVTWNVGGIAGPAGAPLADGDVGAVAATLRGLDFDLACVVELAGAAQARTLAAALGGDVAVQVALGERPLALYARGGELRRRSAAGARARARRPCLVALWRDDRLAAPVAVAALHASPWSARARNDELGALLEDLEAVEVAGARLLLGDLNLEVALEGRQDVFTDDAHLDVETYGFVTRRLVDAGRAAGATAEPDRRLDYVLASSALEVVHAAVARGHRLASMDHDPLVVDLRPR